MTNSNSNSNSNENKRATGRILITIEPMDLAFEGRTVRAVVLETPIGGRIIASDGNAANVVDFLNDVARDPTIPRAEIEPKVSWAEVARDALRDLAKGS